MNVGDIILTRDPKQGPVSRAIQFGQKLRYGKNSPHAQWNHVAIVSERKFGQRPMVVEALTAGVVERPLPYSAEYFKHIPLDISEEDQKQIRRFLDAVLRARYKYGWVTITGLSLYTVTGGSLTVQKSGTAICSGLVCDALTRAGYVWPRPPFSMMPADIAVHFA